MSDLNLSVDIDNLELPMDYEVNISMDLPEGTFAAVEESEFDLDSGVRTMDVTLMKLHVPAENSEDAADADAALSPAGKLAINSGLYARLEGEKELKIVVKQDGKEVTSTTVAYAE